jgi:protein-tyrosine phosphatase
MNAFSSSLLNKRLRFGKYPTEEEASKLIRHKYLIFVDLCPNEEIIWEPYYDETGIKDDITRIHYPIKDRTANPTADIGNKQFDKLILKLKEYILDDKRVYIHCRGGHGRSGLVSAILYGVITECDSETALDKIYSAHQRRTEMKPKMRKLGAPQTAAQRKRVVNYLDK